MPKLIGYVVKGKQAASGGPGSASGSGSEKTGSGSGTRASGDRKAVSPPDAGARGYPEQGLFDPATNPLSGLQGLDGPRLGPPPDAYVEHFIPVDEATPQIRSIAIRDLHSEPAPSSSGGGRQAGTESSMSENDASSHASSTSKDSRKGLHRISPSSWQDMRRVSKQLQRDTTWFRVVHSGYGQEAWRAAVQNHGLVVIQAHSPAEGTYVRIPDETSPEDMVLMLTDINLSVRKRTRFKDMNRANKSRLQFKVEPFVVSSATDSEKPLLVHTTRFAGLAAQKDDDSEITFSGESLSSGAAPHSATCSTMDDSAQREDHDDDLRKDEFHRDEKPQTFTL